MKSKCYRIESDGHGRIHSVEMESNSGGGHR